tara:strand:- start:16724 stop:16978 length:255 start_codon:yes stop_codon:yes gene_type:complete
MKIEITCTRRVKFSKIVEITPEQWDELQNANEDGKLQDSDRSELDNYLDFQNDITEAEDFEDIEVNEVDDGGNIVHNGAELCCY